MFCINPATPTLQGHLGFPIANPIPPPGVKKIKGISSDSPEKEFSPGSNLPLMLLRGRLSPQKPE